jgi:hypothetical protein
MKHATFKDAAIAEAFQTIEGVLLPSLTLLVDRAAGATPGVDAEARAEELRALTQQLDELRALFGMNHSI